MSKTKTAVAIKRMIKNSIDCTNELKRAEDSLDKMPQLKELLKIYVSQNDEENADISTSALVHEYLWLKNSKKLHLLFVSEYINITNGTDGSEWL